MKLTRSDLRVLRWLATFCGPMGTTVGKVSATIGKPDHYGLIDRDGHAVTLTGVGWHALIASGYVPTNDNGKTLEDLTREGGPMTFWDDVALRREFGLRRAQVTDEAIKRALIEGREHVYVWDTFLDAKWSCHAAASFPTDTPGLVGDVTRIELGNGIVVDRTDLPRSGR